MAVYLNCPYCGEEHRLHLKYAAVDVGCPSCGRSFVPVAHTGVPCPKCGSVVLTAPGCTDTRPICLECGHRFRTPRRDRDFLLVVSIVTFVNILSGYIIIKAFA